MHILILCISFVASCVGAVCGVGGGVIIKPCLDMAGAASVSEVSFLSGCTVLCMSCYSVVHSFLDKTGGGPGIRLATTIPLSIGAAVGGTVGKSLFSALTEGVAQQDMVGAVQAGVLFVLTLGTLLYTHYKEKIRRQKHTNKVLCLLIGFVLDFFSSFLGIGGSPFNLVILSYFFSMDTKEAVQNSLFVILCSQISSLLSTAEAAAIPEYSIPLLIGMAAMGILGGVVGKKLYNKLDADKIDILFIGMLGVILAICACNMLRFGGGFL